MAEQLLDGPDVTGAVEADCCCAMAEVVGAPLGAEASLDPLVDRLRMKMPAESAREVVHVGALLDLELMQQRRSQRVERYHPFVTVLADHPYGVACPVAGVGGGDLFPSQAERGAEREHRAFREGSVLKSVEHD